MSDNQKQGNQTGQDQRQRMFNIPSSTIFPNPTNSICSNIFINSNQHQNIHNPNTKINFQKLENIGLPNNQFSLNVEKKLESGINNSQEKSKHISGNLQQTLQTKRQRTIQENNSSKIQNKLESLTNYKNIQDQVQSQKKYRGTIKSPGQQFNTDFYINNNSDLLNNNLIMGQNNPLTSDATKINKLQQQSKGNSQGQQIWTFPPKNVKNHINYNRGNNLGSIFLKARLIQFDNQGLDKEQDQILLQKNLKQWDGQYMTNQQDWKFPPLGTKHHIDERPRSKQHDSKKSSASEYPFLKKK